MKKKQIIGAIMAETGESVETVANKHGYSKYAFYDVIRGRTQSPHIKSLISTITKKTVSELFPL